MIRIRDLSAYFSSINSSIQTVMQRLNGTVHLFQLVVDDDRRLLGTLTDGDVRRALLNDISLDAPVQDCMHTDFIGGRKGADTENQALLQAGARPVNFVPVLDEDGRVAEVLVRDDGVPEIAHALIMAGGFGRRLGNRTKETPKPLLPVGGHPILEHVLRGLEGAGVPEVHISVHYLADQIKRFIETRSAGTSIRVIEEEAPLGTAGALAELVKVAHSPVLVVNGDVITSVEFAAVHEFHIRHGLDATVGVAQYNVDVPFGVVRYGDDGLFAGIDEKPQISNFIAAGIYYLSPEFLALVPDGRPMDMPELLNLGRDIGLKIGLFPIHEYWTDLGHPEDLDAAEVKMRGVGE